MFGGAANKPATGFGGGSAGSGLFGSANTTGGFGSNTTNTSSGLFGAAQGTALGGNTPECQGTGSTPFSAYTEKEANSSVTNHYQAVSFMQPYQKYSFEVRAALFRVTSG